MMKTTYEYALFLITRFQPWAKLKSAEWTGHIYGASNLMQLYKSRYPGTCVSIKTLFAFYKSRVNPFSKKSPMQLSSAKIEVWCRWSYPRTFELNLGRPHTM